MTYINVDRQVCMIKTVAYRARTDWLTPHWQTKKVKTEGLKILSNYIFYFKTVIFGGPILGMYIGIRWQNKCKIDEKGFQILESLTKKN